MVLFFQFLSSATVSIQSSTTNLFSFQSMTLATPHQNHSLCKWKFINITFWCLTLITVHLISINNMQDLHAITQSTPFLYLDTWYWHRTKWHTTKLKSTRGANLLKKNLPCSFTITEQTFTRVLFTLRAWLVPWFLLTVLFTEKKNVRKSLNGNVFKFINLDNSTCFRVSWLLKYPFQWQLAEPNHPC